MEVYMDVLMIAGGAPTEDAPLYPFSKGRAKALIDVAGKPMGQWVLDALSGAKTVERVVIVGPEELRSLHCSKQTHFLQDLGDLFTNALAGARHIQELNPSAGHILVTGSDIPAITSEMVDWRVEQALKADRDLSYLIIERQVMESKFPTSNRSYVRLKDVEVCGGDMHTVRLSMVDREEVYTPLIAARKSPLKQAAIIGFDTLLLVLLRRATLKRAEEIVSKRLGLAGHVELSPFPELGMDIDKPHQLEILRQHMAVPGESTQ
jgi:GTP:adenosylcobinamide-phosphate guanylyltransferase